MPKSATKAPKTKQLELILQNCLGWNESCSIKDTAPWVFIREIGGKHYIGLSLQFGFVLEDLTYERESIIVKKEIEVTVNEDVMYFRFDKKDIFLKRKNKISSNISNKFIRDLLQELSYEPGKYENKWELDIFKD